MAFSLGFNRSISAKCASRTSTGLMARLRISDAKSRAVFRVSDRSATLLARPVHEGALDELKQQVQAVAERAGGEDRRIHVGHVEELLGLEHALAEAVGGADEHFGNHDDDQRKRHAVAQADEGL